MDSPAFAHSQTGLGELKGFTRTPSASVCSPGTAKSKTITVIIDGTERRRQRPQDPKKQALHYSGKKKVHSDKNVVLVDAKTMRVGYLSQTRVGKTHDKKVAENERISYPREATLYKDTGFQGYEPRVQKTFQPKKNLGREN